jgi:serine/threonine-protein kinase
MKGSVTSENISHYRILSKLGAGGMGEVYLAEDTRLDRKVAIKFLPPDSVADERASKRLIREAQAAAKLDHPNICAIHEVAEEDNRTFIVMQYVEGETLSSRIKRKSLELRETLDLAAQVADALTHAHWRGIIHRDIKPQNIMITARGQVKVLDFGLAKVVQERPLLDSLEETESLFTQPGMIVGTLPYMSPEQVRGENLDARSDIFSFGAVLYEMVSRMQPFAAENAAATISSILTHEPPPLARYSRDVPAELERIVSKALRKDCEERYQTVKDLLIDLRDFKQELEFAAKLERTAPTKSTADEAAAVTTVQNAQTISSAEYLAGEIKNHKVAALAALLVLTIGIAALYYFTRGNVLNKQTNNETINSIAVLPFANAAQDPNAEYLSDGITESLINRLSQLSGLKVMSSGSIFRYKGKEQDAQKVGNELNVRVVLTGSIKQIGDQLVINVRLDDVQDSHRIWGEQYVRKFADVLGVQSDIAQEVSTNLRVKLTGADERQLAKRYTDNVEAYQLYLKGQYEWNKHTQEDLQKSIEYYNQALEKDPNYALAYYGLSGCYGVLGNNYLLPNEAFPKAKAYAAKALAIDETLAEAHVAMGAVRLFYDWDWTEAEKELKRAQTLDPNNVTAHQLYGDWLEIMGRFDETKAERKRALELDPLSLAQNMVTGATFYFAGQYTEAIEQLEKTINLEPHLYPAYYLLGPAYEQKKMYREAIETYQKGMTQAERHPQLIAALGHAYALTGERDKARKTLDELREMSKRRYISPYLFAVVYVGLGDKDQAFAWLDKAYQDRAALLIWLRVERLFDPLRDDQRFQDLLRRVGLTS